ncbi:MAG: hypothetical protein CMG74_10465 [Candidatus Marinimicrobia bacterium]|nr:hypothetical protein [Candidatus Neomarinimicrobiota bacterium]|tara:strand:- start:17349 stop:18815 length:1467 start_codon:yes stop_codon:yes gene_type:complete
MNKTLKADASIYLLSVIIAKSIGIISLPIYTRYLSLDEYGVFSMFGVFGLTASGLLSVGLMHSTYRYFFEFKNSQTENFKILNFSNIVFLISIFSLGSLIVYYFSDLIIHYVFKTELSTNILMLSFLSGVLTYFLDYNLLLLTALKRSIIYGVFNICRPLFMLSLSLIFFNYLDYNIYAIILGQLLGISIVLFISYFFLLDQFKLYFSASYVKTSILYSYPLLPRSIIGQIYSSFDKVMLTFYAGFSGVGLYSLSAKYSEVIKLIMASLDKVWHPYFLENATLGDKTSKQKIIDKFEAISFLIIFLGLIISFFGQEAIIMLSTKEFHNASYYIPIYMFFYIFSVIGMMGYMQITFAKKMKYFLFGSIGSIATNIFLNILLIPIYGVMGACISTALAALVGAILNAYNGQKVYRLPINFIKLFLLIGLAMIFSVIPFVISISNDQISILLIISKLFLLLIFLLISILLGLTTSKNILGYFDGILSFVRK